MAKKWTPEELRAMSVRERADLYKNACRLAHTPEGAALKKDIEDAGLPFSEEAALKGDDPILLRMHEVIYSKEGREAALKATKDGLPAMAGVDPLLAEALGSDYGPHNRSTINAGEIVGSLMRSLGYKKDLQRTLPEHCVATSATLWV